MNHNIRKNWYMYLTGTLLLLQAAVFLVFRGESYFQIHDNLDLFMGHYEMLKKGHLWFAHGVDAPILHGVSRDLFGSISTTSFTYCFPPTGHILQGTQPRLL